MNSRVAYWVDLSRYDLETADAMLITQRFLYVGFMAHQAIEKILKALFVNRVDDAPPHSHSLLLLARKAGVSEDMSEEQCNTIDILEPLNIEARYPTHKERLMKSLTEEKCREILTRTRELHEWICQKL